MQYFKPATSAIMMTLANPKLDSLGLKGITLLAFLQGMLLLKELAAAKLLSWSKGIFPEMLI